MRDKKKLKLLYELESLVMNNGDKREIDKLRIELGVHPKQREPYFGFCPDRYRALKKAGLLEYEIAKEFNMSHSGMYKNKVKYGLL